MIKIALDVAVGKRRARQLEDLGYKIVCVANESESDDSWLNRAFASDAMFAISPDLDIPNLIEKEGYPIVWIDYPNNTPKFKDSLVEYIHKKISMKHKIFARLIGVSHETR